MINKIAKNILIIVVSIFITIAIAISAWFVFDFSSKIDVLRHPEKYSFRFNFASFTMQNDYYLAKNPDINDTFFEELKAIEKEYENKSDETSRKIYHLNNHALDLFHDLLSLKTPESIISNNDYIFLFKNCNKLASFYYMYLMCYPEIEEKSVLYEELNVRKEAISIVNNDLKDRKINAVATLDDIRYENLIPAYLESTKPTFVKEFEKEYEKGVTSLGKEIEKDIDNVIKKAKTKDEGILISLDYANKLHSKYLSFIDNFNIKWKHRYLVQVIEYKNNKSDKIIHLYEVYPYKEGNRIYWNIQYYPPNSEFLKAYMKMLELLMNF